MCRSIKTLRPPYTEQVTEREVHEAALQYVRKIAGMRQPSRANQAAFDLAVAEVARVSAELLDGLVLPARRPVEGHEHTEVSARAAG